MLDVKGEAFASHFGYNAGANFAWGIRRYKEDVAAGAAYFRPIIRVVAGASECNVWVDDFQAFSIPETPSWRTRHFGLGSFDLATERDNVHIDIGGNYFEVLKCPDVCYIRFNDPTDALIPLHEGFILRSDYTGAWLTNPAGVGTLVFIQGGAGRPY